MTADSYLIIAAVVALILVSYEAILAAVFKIMEVFVDG